MHNKKEIVSICSNGYNGSCMVRSCVFIDTSLVKRGTDGKNAPRNLCRSSTCALSVKSFQVTDQFWNACILCATYRYQEALTRGKRQEYLRENAGQFGRVNRRRRSEKVYIDALEKCVAI